MDNKVNLNEYENFVVALTSTTSKDVFTMVNRLHELGSNIRVTKGKECESDVDISLYLTSAMGLCSEAGEYMEIAKKCLWQNKPFNEETRYHAMRELGDIIFYWSQACRALGFNPNEVIAENVSKLQSRYPGGKFDPYHSENRKEGDL